MNIDSYTYKNSDITLGIKYKDSWRFVKGNVVALDGLWVALEDSREKGRPQLGRARFERPGGFKCESLRKQRNMRSDGR